MTTEPRYGLLTAKEARGNAGFLNHLSPEWTEAQRAAWEEQRLTHETDLAAFYIAQGPYKLPMGRTDWTLRANDRTRAETLTLHPLPRRSVRDLLKAGIIDTRGVVIEAWRAECERLRL